MKKIILILIALVALKAPLLSQGYELWGWGDNIFGQLGNGTLSSSSTPIRIGKDDGWNLIASDEVHTLGTKTDGSLWAWGKNDNYQLGDGSLESKKVPFLIESIDANYISITTKNGNTSYGIKSNGSLWSWGGEYNYNKTIYTGNKTPTRDKAYLAYNDNVTVESGVELLNGNYFLVVFTSDHKILGYDGNEWEKFSVGMGYVLVIKTDGSLWSLVVGNTTLIPKRIGTDNDWKEVNGGIAHTLALKTDGTLWAWGSNENGQLGDGSNENKLTPTRIGTDYDWNEISASDHSLAIKTNGTLWAWGINGASQLGDGTTKAKNVPTQIGTDTNWVKVFTSKNNSFALRAGPVKYYSASGYLKDEQSVGVAGINIKITDDSNSVTQTLNNGKFTFNNLKNGTYVITPDINSLYTFSPESQTFTIKKSSITSGIDFVAIKKVIPKYYSLEGMIKDETNLPVQNISISLSGVSNTITQTLSNGSYTFSNLPNGSYVITPQTTSSYTFSPSTKTITIGGSNISSGLDFVAVKVQLPTFYTISGKIKNEKNQDISGINVELSGVSNKTTQTKVDGTYSFSTLLKGLYTITPQSNASYTFSPINRASDISTSDISGVDFTAIQKTGVSTYLLSGSVFDLDNNIELPNVAINISGDVSANLLSDKLGKYSIILSKGSYTITPVISGFTFSPSYQTLNIISDTTFNFTANVIKFKVSGKVVDNNKLPISNLLITTNTGKSTKSIIDGNYEFLLRPGDYTIKPDLSSYTSVPDSINVTVSNSDIPNNDFTLALPSVTYNISGDVVDASGLGIANIEVILSSKIVKTDANGKFTFNNIAQGKHVIVPSANEYYFEPTYSEINLTSNINNLKFKAIKLTELPSCLSSRDTTLPSVYVFDPYLASKRGFVEVVNDCSEDYTITDIALSGNSNQFKILHSSDFLPLVISSFKSVNIPIEFKPTKAGLDSVYMRLIFGQKQKAVKVKSAGVDGGPGLPYTVMTMRTKPESAKPGEKVELYLLIPKASNYTLTSNDYYEAEYTIKTQLVTNLDTINTPNITKFARDGKTGDFYPGTSNPNGYTTVRFQGRYIPQYAGKSPSFIDTLAKFRFIATLGNQDSTNIIINDFRWLSGGAKAEIYNDGVFRIIPCEAGGERLIGWESQSKVTLQSIAPNPTSDNITLKINSSVELENSEIEIINVLGMSILKVNNFLITKGDSEIKLDLHNIPNGFYTIRLNKDIQIVFFKE